MYFIKLPYYPHLDNLYKFKYIIRLMKLDPFVEHDGHEYLVKVIDNNDPKVNLANPKGFYVGAKSISGAKQIGEKACPQPRYQVIEVIPII